MLKGKTIDKILECGVVAVVRATSEEEAIKISDACIAGGIVGIEVTFTVPGAEKVINALVNKFGSDKLLVGAGTVLDAVTARVAILNGAAFIVSPGFDKEVAEVCNLYQVPYMPGCFTITEMVTAMKAGVDVIKLFPGSAGSPSYVKAVKGPLPQVNIMPTGGVNLDNVDQWIKSGCVAVGAGSDLTGPAKKGDYAGVTELAKQFVSKVKQARECK